MGVEVLGIEPRGVSENLGGGELRAGGARWGRLLKGSNEEGGAAYPALLETILRAKITLSPEFQACWALQCDFGVLACDP